MGGNDRAVLRIMSGKLDLRPMMITILPWLLAACAILSLLAVIVSARVAPIENPEMLTLRSVEVAAPPSPPEPPPSPTKVQQQHAATPTPTVDLFGVDTGVGQGPAVRYSANPKLELNRLQQVPQPEFDKDAFTLSPNLSIDFPLLEVKELDSAPRLLSTNRISFPRHLRENGINRVATQVEIIIDQQGKAYVKKIVDPVYPEMVEVIRKAINDSRFTVPTKNGRPVQAIYLYTLVFINKT